MKLKQQNAIITGASQGLGKAIAQEFVLEGANVLLCSRSTKEVEEVGRELRKISAPDQQILVQQCDVANPDQVHDLFEQARKAFNGRLHILVNNAGIYGPKGASESVDFDEWVRTIQINLYGTFLACRAAIPIFKANRFGKIINLSGGGATAPLPMISAYSASKAAVVRLTETLAEELKEFGIDVNAIAPGALNTRLLDEVLEAGPGKVGQKFFEKALQQQKEGGVPLEKGAKLCVYLGSSESNGITGKLISAQWDPWERLKDLKKELVGTDIYTLRRIVPEDRGKKF